MGCMGATPIPPAYTDNRTVQFFYFCGLTQGAENSFNKLSCFLAAELSCCRSDSLEDDFDKTLSGIGVCNCKRDSLSVLPVYLAG